MFKNVGAFFMVAAVVTFAILGLGALIGAIVVWSIGGDFAFVIGLAILIVGALFAELVSYIIFGYGIIVADHEKSLAKEESKSADYGSITNRTPSVNEWKCPKCGKINQNYVGTCGCGQLKP